MNEQKWFTKSCNLSDLEFRALEKKRIQNEEQRTGRKALGDFDVTNDGLAHLGDNLPASKILDALRSFWTSETSRVGSVHAYMDIEGAVHVEFISRFANVEPVYDGLGELSSFKTRRQE